MISHAFGFIPTRVRIGEAVHRAPVINHLPVCSGLAQALLEGGDFFGFDMGVVGLGDDFGRG
jgi:hypothetical protein